MVPPSSPSATGPSATVLLVRDALSSVLGLLDNGLITTEGDVERLRYFIGAGLRRVGDADSTLADTVHADVREGLSAAESLLLIHSLWPPERAEACGDALVMVRDAMLAVGMAPM